MSKPKNPKNAKNPKNWAEGRVAPPGPAVTPIACPCGRAESYRDCCGAFHQGRAAAPTAERLMRSRYSAFAVGDTGYLLRTWHPTTRPGGLDLEPAQHWTGLEILGATGGTAFHTGGTVEFRAHFRLDGHTDSQYDHSRFVRESGEWVYLDALSSV